MDMKNLNQSIKFVRFFQCLSMHGIKSIKSDLSYGFENSLKNFPFLISIVKIQQPLFFII